MLRFFDVPLYNGVHTLVFEAMLQPAIRSMANTTNLKTLKHPILAVRVLAPII